MRIYSQAVTKYKWAKESLLGKARRLMGIFPDKMRALGDQAKLASFRTHPDDLPAARARIRNIQRQIHANPIYGDALSGTKRPAQNLPSNRLSVAQ